MSFFDSLKKTMGIGWAPDVPTQGVRSDYGLHGASISPTKSEFNPSFEPGEAKTSDIQSALADIIMSAAPMFQASPPQAGNPARRRVRGGSSRGGREGWRRVYHGTTSEEGIRPEPGLHVGTPRQASNIVSLEPGVADADYKPGARIYPLEMSRKARVAKINDLGHATESPGVMASELMRRGVLTPEEANSAWKMSDIYRLLQSKGYDALKYRNRFEGRGDSFTVINPLVIRGAFK